MLIKLADVLVYSGLKSARAIAGINGLNRRISNLSVYDRDFVEAIDYDKDLLYITSLPHLRNSDTTALNWFKKVYECGACGILLIEEAMDLIDDSVIGFCNEKAFPLILLDKNVTYAEIIEHISALLHFNNVYARSEEILRKIVYENLSRNDVRYEVEKIISNAGDITKILMFKGEKVSELVEKELHSIVDRHKTDLFVKLNDNYVVIVTADNESEINRKVNFYGEIIMKMYENVHIGESDFYVTDMLDDAILNSENVLKIAEIKNVEYESYNPFSEYGLILSMKKTVEVRNFCESFKEKIEEYDSNGKMEYMECIKAYSKYGGNYSEAAAKLNQSEATLRYRIKRLKEILSLENNDVKFHEIILLFIAIDEILEYEKAK